MSRLAVVTPSGTAAQPGRPVQCSLRSLRRSMAGSRRRRWATATAITNATTSNATTLAGTRSLNGVPRAGGAAAAVAAAETMPARLPPIVLAETSQPAAALALAGSRVDDV